MKNKGRGNNGVNESWPRNGQVFVALSHANSGVPRLVDRIAGGKEADQEVKDGTHRVVADEEGVIVVSVGVVVAAIEDETLHKLVGLLEVHDGGHALAVVLSVFGIVHPGRSGVAINVAVVAAVVARADTIVVKEGLGRR